MQSCLGPGEINPYPHVNALPSPTPRLYNVCVQPTILYNCIRWAQNDLDLQRLQYNDRAMLRWICGVKAKDGVSSDDLLAKLHLFDATVELRTCHLRWFGHVKCSDILSSVLEMALPGKRGQGGRYRYLKPVYV